MPGNLCVSFHCYFYAQRYATLVAEPSATFVHQVPLQHIIARLGWGDEADLLGQGVAWFPDPAQGSWKPIPVNRRAIAGPPVVAEIDRLRAGGFPTLRSPILQYNPGLVYVLRF